jgi:hypothetical protein
MQIKPSEYTQQRPERVLAEVVDARVTFNPECTETEGEIAEQFRQLYSKVGMIQQASMERIRLGIAAEKVRRISAALEMGADPERVLEELDKVDVEVNGRVRR